ncbi:MAG: hypothetical protein M0Z70_06665 [Nitrospiraceae bacterium]|jgi:hypothetical protein|nr:hypothetical protein [Nitrospiraceae bacterium]
MEKEKTAVRITDTSSILPLKKSIRVSISIGSITIEKKGSLLDLFLIENVLFEELAALLDEKPANLRKKMINRFNYAKKFTLIQ